MTQKKNILAIIGSAGNNSANRKLVELFVDLTKEYFEVTVFEGLKTLPHFDPELSTGNPPHEVVDFRKNIENADGVLICTPEYVFSIPAGLKNAIEWCVATTVFSGKPAGIITASASGLKAHEELQLIMKTLMANFTNDTTLLIQGVKGKIGGNGLISDKETQETFLKFIRAFENLWSN